MEWHSLLNLIFSCLGIPLLVYGLFIVRRIRSVFPKAKIMKHWTICFILILFFVIGYFVNILAIILDNSIISEIMTASVYLLGAVFIVGVLAISHLTYRLIKESATS